MPDQPQPTQHKPRFLAAAGMSRDYVDHPSLGVHGEPECVGPAILDGYAEAAAFHRSLQHAKDVELAQKVRPLLAAEDRILDIRRRAKASHVDMTREVHLMQRDLERAKRGNRKPPVRVVERLEGLEALLDGIAA